MHTRIAAVYLFSIIYVFLPSHTYTHNCSLSFFNNNSIIYMIIWNLTKIVKFYGFIYAADIRFNIEDILSRFSSISSITFYTGSNLI